MQLSTKALIAGLALLGVSSAALDQKAVCASDKPTTCSADNQSMVLCVGKDHSVSIPCYSNWTCRDGFCRLPLSGSRAAAISLHKESNGDTVCFGEAEKAMADFTHYEEHLAQSALDIKLILKMVVHRALDSIDCSLLKDLMERFGLPAVSPTTCREFLTLLGKILDELVFDTVTLTSLDAVGQATTSGQHQFMVSTMDSVMGRFGNKQVESMATQLNLPAMSEKAKASSVDEIRRVVHKAMAEFETN